MTLQELLQQHQ